MTAVNQGMSVEEIERVVAQRVANDIEAIAIWMSVEEIERVVAQRVANAIEAIAIYETKTNLGRKSMSQTKRQKEKVAENARNKRK
nr:hypothetical protein [Tanacetum cinerariifolium]